MATKAAKRPTMKQVDKAMDVIARYGRAGFCATSEVTRGECIGMAVYSRNDADICCNAAIEMLEEWNFHFEVALLNAVQRGQGRVRRNGRFVKITLPKHWHNAQPSNKETT